MALTSPPQGPSQICGPSVNTEEKSHPGPSDCNSSQGPHLLQYTTQQTPGAWGTLSCVFNLRMSKPCLRQPAGQKQVMDLVDQSRSAKLPGRGPAWHREDPVSFSLCTQNSLLSITRSDSCPCRQEASLQVGPAENPTGRAKDRRERSPRTVPVQVSEVID